MKKTMQAICLGAAVLVMAGCASGGGYYNNGYGYGRTSASVSLGGVYYDGYYGPYNGGYWGRDGSFYYSNGGRYFRDSAGHFRRGEARGFRRYDSARAYRGRGFRGRG